jgi:hypothetical protein
MDDVVNPRLLETRFVKIQAEIGPGVKFDKGGKMNVGVSAGLQPADVRNQAVGHVKIEIIGIPAGAKNEKDFSFKVELVCNGLYEWLEGASRPDDLRQIPLTMQLCNPLHALVVAEVGHITQRLGFPNVRIPWDIPTNTKPVARRASLKAPARKKTAAKSSRMKPPTAK